MPLRGISTDSHGPHNRPVSHLKLDRMSADYALLLAKRRAESKAPFSLAWDAAMHVVEDCEREAYRLDQLWLERHPLSH
jgi:hypothetical protein